MPTARNLIVCCVAIAAMLLVSCDGGDSGGEEPFPSSIYIPPKSEYDGPLFKLSQDYPKERPDGPLPAFFETDFKKDWRKYMLQVRDYCFEGNVEADWRVENNKVRRWYHMPWQHYGLAGREGIHGLTQEVALNARQVAATQTYPSAAAHAIGFYNDRGGYTIGQVWKDHDDPDPKPAATDGFPIGTVVCKTLFLDMPTDLVEEQVPYLVNPVRWQAYATASYNSTEHVVKPLTLIQMDVMIRDSRAPVGWIFGTFQYNGALNRANRWENLVPVGLMWGNDPDYAGNVDDIPVLDPRTHNFKPDPVFTRTPINKFLEETVINPDDSELPPTHLGWGGRLNGPVDTPKSACMSCHMTASDPQEPLLALIVAPSKRPPSGTKEWDEWWMQWFQNVGWKGGKLDGFMGAKQPLDFSLQMSDSIQNFRQSKAVEPVNAITR